MIGTVKFFNDVKGFGFITCDDKSVGDCFVHYSDIQQSEGRKTLRDGTRVEFDVETTDKGLRAKNVTPAAAVQEIGGNNVFDIRPATIGIRLNTLDARPPESS